MITTSLIPVDEVVHFDVCTHAPSTGAVSDADSTPTFDVFEEATDTAILSAQSFTKRTSLTGNYRGTFTASAANGFEAGKWYSVIASATVGGVAAKKNCGSFRVAPAETAAGVPLADVNTKTGFSLASAYDAAKTAATQASVDDLPTNAELATALGTADDAVLAAIPSAATVADAVWDEARAGHVTAGTYGEGVASVQGDVSGDVVGSVGSVAVGGIDASSFAAGAIDAAAIAADAIGASELAASAVDEILDDTIGDSTVTVRQALKLLVATLGGKLAGAGTTTITIRNVADTADVVAATVDASGNRTAVTLTL